MARYARIIDGVVTSEPVEIDSNLQLGVDIFPPDEARLYQPCGAEVHFGWLFKNGQFSPAPPAPKEPVAPALDPVEKLKAFLAANPDVRTAIGA